MDFIYLQYMDIEKIWLKFKSNRSKKLKYKLAEYYCSISEKFAKTSYRQFLPHPLFDADDACSLAYLVMIECINVMPDIKVGEETYDLSFRKIMRSSVNRRMINEYKETCNELGSTNLELKSFLRLIQNSYYLHHGRQMNDLEIKSACSREKKLRKKDEYRTAKRSEMKTPTPWILARLQILDPKHRLNSFEGIPTWDQEYDDSPFLPNILLESLSDMEIKVLRMRMNCCTYEHISAFLGENIKVVDNVLSRIRKKARKLITEHESFARLC